MPKLSAEAGRVVARRRIKKFRSLRAAAAETGVSIGTWQRIEKEGNFEYSSLVLVVDALEWPSEAVDQLLAGQDPDAPAPAEEPEPTFETDYNSRIARMPDHVRRTIDDLIDGFERRRGED